MLQIPLVKNIRDLFSVMGSHYGKKRKVKRNNFYDKQTASW